MFHVSCSVIENILEYLLNTKKSFRLRRRGDITDLFTMKNDLRGFSRFINLVA